jgi:solute carrier family 25 carnitine/acylcarnitine transporter 20/29
MGQMFFNAVQFVVYGQAQDFLRSASNQKELSTNQYFIAGALTGSAVAFVESPVDLFKSQLQVQIFEEKTNPNQTRRYNGVFDCASKIGRNYGIKGVYHGLTITIMRDIPAVSLYFGSYEWAKKFLRKEGESNLASWKLLTAGSLGGFNYWFATYPLDVIKSAIQSDKLSVTERKYSGIIDCVKKLYREGGYRRFFLGLSPCLIRSLPANAACFFGYEKTKQFIEKL